LGNNIYLCIEIVNFYFVEGYIVCNYSVLNGALIVRLGKRRYAGSGVKTMDSAKIGRLILSLRKEEGMTQHELALLLNVSEQAISKWERGLGCPDISLLNSLSEILGVHIEKILSGDLQPNDKDRGSMRRIKWYSCKSCSNVMTSTGEANLSCCGRILEPLLSKPINEEHSITVEEIEDDYYVTMRHEMTRDHHISFLAYVSMDRVLLIKFYPEQDPDTRFPKMHGGTLYFHCIQHGLFQYDVKKTLERRGAGEKSITDH
jgi:DNA-binding XRE family transcriptional regulator/desulfoferrodoxin (superoxide reductase-like protein)